MQNLHKVVAWLIIVFASISHVYANQKTHTNWVLTEKMVKNITGVISYIKAHSQLPAVFPTRIPSEDVNLFAVNNSADNQADYQRYWMISVATDAHCQTKNCMVGYVSAIKDGKLELSYLQAPFGEHNQPVLKQKVKLARHLTGYYTPGHAEADWHDPMLEWQDHRVIYTLMWKISGSAKPTLITMANSAIR